MLVRVPFPPRLHLLSPSPSPLLPLLHRPSFAVFSAPRFAAALTSSPASPDAPPSQPVMDDPNTGCVSTTTVVGGPAEVTQSDLRYEQAKLGRSKTGAYEIGGFSIEGVSVGGQETCVMVPAMKVAFDIGRCPERAISQDFLFISHAHMDHIGGVCMYVATRGLFKMKPPTVIVPSCIKATVEKLFDVHRELDGSELNHQLIGLDIGEEYDMGKNFIVKAFKTCHVIPSQWMSFRSLQDCERGLVCSALCNTLKPFKGYVVYSVKNKLKPQYLGLPGEKIKDLKVSGVQITNTTMVPEVAFTGDTTPDFILDAANKDALQAKLLIMETTFLDDSVTIEHARCYGHTHLFEVLKHAHRFENKSILFIHFSARYKREEILRAIEDLPSPLRGRVGALTEGF